MIEREIYQLLTENSQVIDNVSETSGQPSIFPDYAPEGCEFPYVVFKCGSSDSPDSVIDNILLEIQAFDYDENSITIKNVVKGIQIAVDRKMFSSDNWYRNVRIFVESINKLDNLDIKAQQYIINCLARGTRQGVISNY